MGFYIDMNRKTGPEFAEGAIPPAFWALYAFAGFALACMGLAAHTLLGDLARMGSDWDRAIVGIILAAFPVYFLIGLKLGFARRYVSFRGDTLRVGFRLFGRGFLEKRIPRAEVASFELLNRRPSPNIAPVQHEDSQYYIRGHWRLVAYRKHGRPVTIDKHTERGALEPIYDALLEWRKA